MKEMLQREWPESADKYSIYVIMFLYWLRLPLGFKIKQNVLVIEMSCPTDGVFRVLKQS